MFPPPVRMVTRCGEDGSVGTEMVFRPPSVVASTA